jgi:Zn-finger nucleic acid-binding protein
MMRLFCASLILLICVSAAFAQTEVRLKLADGSYMTVDDAWESPQGVWYRRGGINNVLPKEKVKKIERVEPEAAATPEKPSSNDDDHFDAVDVAKAPVAKKTAYDSPAWIFLKGGARVETDSATESAAGVWYKRGGMSIFIDRSRIDRI